MWLLFLIFAALPLALGIIMIIDKEHILALVAFVTCLLPLLCAYADAFGFHHDNEILTE